MSSSPVRVGFFVPRFPVPSETFVNSQIEGLAERGADVDIISLDREPGALKMAGDLRAREVRFAPQLPLNKAARLSGAWSVAAGLRRRPDVIARSLNVLKWGKTASSLRLLYAAGPFVGEWYDVIHCHFGPMGRLAVILREIGALKGRITTVFHGYDVSNTIARRGASYYDLLFERADLLLPVSEHWRKRLLELGADPERTRVHHMGVRLPSSAGSTGSPPPVRLVSVCRLVEKKGIEYAIRALAEMESGAAWEYRVIGDGPERERLQHLVSARGLQDRVHFEGWLDPAEVSEALRTADAMVAPSVTAANGDQEGIPVAIMEAMGHGLPVVSSRHTGIPEIVVHGETGYLAAERDTRELSKHLSKLIDDPEARKRMGAAGREMVAAEYEIDSLNDALFRLLSRLSGRTPSQFHTDPEDY